MQTGLHNADLKLSLYPKFREGGKVAQITQTMNQQSLNSIILHIV